MAPPFPLLFLYVHAQAPPHLTSFDSCLHHLLGTSEIQISTRGYLWMGVEGILRHVSSHLVVQKEAAAIVKCMQAVKGSKRKVQYGTSVSVRLYYIP